MAISMLPIASRRSRLATSEEPRGRFRSGLAVLGVSALLGLVGCAGDGGATAETDAEAQQALRLYVIDCGSLEVEDVSLFGLADEDVATKELFVPCYLIEHPEGRLLWDAGLPLDVLTGERQMDGGSLELEVSLEERLAELELTPADIDYLAMSHLHFDHAGQANVLNEATHLIQRAEHEAAFADPPAVPFFERELYADLADSETLVLNGVHDVFGDGRVVIHPSPGHTPGHQILFVDLEETGPIVLSGDLYHFPANRELRQPPTFNYDIEQTLASMDAAEELLEKTGATLWIEHDALLAETLRKSPSFYE